jgi:myo-inositol catabolism protein IolS
MQYRQLGRSQLKVSVVAMGCWPIVGDATWGPQDEKDSVAAIHAALDAGINFFDTAEAYGEDGYSEKLLGRELASRRSEVVIASKVLPSHMAAKDLRASCEASLKRLRTDYIDLYQMHWANWDIPIGEPLTVLKRLRDEGKVRVIGCSNFGPLDLAELLGQGRVEANQLAYNMLWRAVEYEVQPICVRHDVSILAYCPLQQGLLTGKFKSPDEVPEGRARTRHFSKDRARTRHGEPGAEQETFEALRAIQSVGEKIGEPMADVALAWLLARPAVASVLAGARNAEQIRINARAADVTLAPDVLERLTRATDVLKERFGTNIDMWQSDSRLR